MTIVFYYSVICAWVANSAFFAVPSQQYWVYPLLLVLHVIIGVRIAWSGRDDHLTPPNLASVVGAGICLAIPALAPLTMTILAGGATRRAAMRRGHSDALALDLAAASRFWWLTGFVGVVLGVLWAYGLFLLDSRPPPGQLLHPFTDPLVLNRERLRPAGHLVILVIATWYAFLLFRTWHMLRRHRADPGPRPAAAGEAAAGDVVY